MRVFVALSLLLLSPHLLGTAKACTDNSLTSNLDGLLGTAFLNDGPQGAENPMVSVTQHQVVCLTTGVTRGTYNFASVIASFTCTGLACPATNLQQLDLSCDPGLTNTWTPVTFAAPIGDLTTALRTDCGRCVQNAVALGSRFDTVTHCIACDPSCNTGTGLMECTGIMDSDCCNGVVGSLCVGSCTAPTRPLDSADYECTEFCDPLSNPANGNITFSDGILVGSVATYVCDTNFEVQGSSSVNRTCEVVGSTTAWSATAPSCVRVPPATTQDNTPATTQDASTPTTQVDVPTTTQETNPSNRASTGILQNCDGLCIGIIIALIIVGLIAMAVCMVITAVILWSIVCRRS